MLPVVMALGALAVGGAGLGFYEYKKHKAPAAAPTPGAPALPSLGSITNYTLKQGSAYAGHLVLNDSTSPTGRATDDDVIKTLQTLGFTNVVMYPSDQALIAVAGAVPFTAGPVIGTLNNNNRYFLASWENATSVVNRPATFMEFFERMPGGTTQAVISGMDWPSGIPPRQGMTWSRGVG